MAAGDAAGVAVVEPAAVSCEAEDADVADKAAGRSGDGVALFG